MIVDEVAFDRGAGQPPDVAAMIEGRRLGLVARGVFSPGALAEAVRRLAAGESELPSCPTAYYVGRSYGRLLTSETDLDAYFDQAGRAEERVRRLFLGTAEPDLVARLRGLLSGLAGGRPVGPGRDPSGRPYLELSFREMLPGGSIALHYENEALDMPTMKHIERELSPRAQLSVYLPMQLPERGGRLRVYDAREGTEVCRRYVNRDRRDPEAFAALEAEVAWVDLDVAVGDVLVFDASRYFHRVTEVEGARSRWTMGCFLGRTASDELWCWT